jgi:hypothetical protein
MSALKLSTIPPTHLTLLVASWYWKYAGPVESPKASFAEPLNVSCTPESTTSSTSLLKNDSELILSRSAALSACGAPDAVITPAGEIVMLLPAE